MRTIIGNGLYTRVATRKHQPRSIFSYPVSCGAGASVGKANDDVRVEGLGAGTVIPDNRVKTAVNDAQSSGSESQQNCAGLGAGWGIQPAGKIMDEITATVDALSTKTPDVKATCLECGCPHDWSCDCGAPICRMHSYDTFGALARYGLCKYCCERALEHFATVRTASGE